MTTRRVVLGYVSGLFGVAGWVKVFSHTRPVDNILEYTTWYVGQDDAPGYCVFEGRRQGKTVVARLGPDDNMPITDRDTAAALVNQPIAVARCDMPALPANEYYWCDLVGLAVYNRDDTFLGHVENLLETTAHDVLELSGERQRLIPFVIGERVDVVDVDAGLIRVDWPADA